MEYQQQIRQYFAGQREKMIEDISRLVRIRSVGEPAEPGKPYGPGPAAALAEALDMAREMGFETKNYDNYVGTVDLNQGPDQLAILAHEGRISTVNLDSTCAALEKNYIGLCTLAGREQR